MERVKLIRRRRGTSDIAVIEIKPLAVLVNKTPWTIRRWVKAGLFPRPFQIVPGSPDVWLLRDVEAHLEKRRFARRVKRPLQGQLKQFKKTGEA